MKTKSVRRALFSVTLDFLQWETERLIARPMILVSTGPKPLQLAFVSRLPWVNTETGKKYLKYCLEEKCFPPREVLEHGVVSCSDKNNVGSVCKFKCTNRAYKLYPPNLDTNVCRDTIGSSVNHWNNVAPCCAREFHLSHAVITRYQFANFAGWMSTIRQNFEQCNSDTAF